MRILSEWQTTRRFETSPRKYLLFTLIPVRFTRNIFLHGPTIRTYSPPTRARRVDSPAHHVSGSASGISACGALIGGSGCSRLLVAVVVLSVAASAATAIAGHRHPPAPRPPPPPPPPPPPCTRHRTCTQGPAPLPRAPGQSRAHWPVHAPRTTIIKTQACYRYQKTGQFLSQ